MILNKTSLSDARSTIVVCLFLLATSGCDSPAQESEREIKPVIVELSIADVSETGPAGLKRPPVEFDHKQHTSALEQEGCETCHPQDQDDDSYIFKFARKDDSAGPKQLMELYHDRCIGCHKKRVKAGASAGPRVCAECHKKKPVGFSSRKEAVFDYSLHYRHVSATGDEKCDSCHHQYDKNAKKLVYKKGEEDACRDCHGQVDVENTIALKKASHLSCVNCHLELVAKAKKKHGPTTCEGCHDAAAIAKYDKVALGTIPRLKRGQKDQVEIKPKGAKSLGVVFDHLAHEKRAAFCTTCHHKTPKPCVECHTQKGAKEGEWVTTENAYHRSSSERSCIGCHQKKTRQVECAGCHSTPMSVTVPAKETCVVCHQKGIAQAPQTVGDAGLPSDAGLDTRRNKELLALPEASDDFPEIVEIATLAKAYKPSKMPHRKIVLTLDESIRRSELATAFHRKAETVCSGCHHRSFSPDAQNPRPCSGCHSLTPEVGVDKPGLRAAYHRQCMGCHESMKLEKARGCTDCHETATEMEVSQ